jgi:hypothetical protein
MIEVDPMKMGQNRLNLARQLANNMRGRGYTHVITRTPSMGSDYGLDWRALKYGSRLSHSSGIHQTVFRPPIFFEDKRLSLWSDLSRLRTPLRDSGSASATSAVERTGSGV